MTGRPPEHSRWRRPVLAAILLLSVLLGGRGLTDESSVMLGADMARYMMNGVFVRDFIVDGGATSLEGLSRYAEQYYARYPALSLGHHPPLPYVALVPFYAVFGISIFGVRIAELCWFVLAAWALYAAARRMFGWHAASWAALLFVTNPLIVRNGQRLLSEMPMLAMVLVSMVLLLDYCDTPRLSRLIGFALAVVASLYAKQLAVFMLPVYLAVLVSGRGWRGLIERHTLLLMGATALVVAPLAVMTVGFSPENFAIAVRQATRLVTTGRRTSIGQIVAAIFSTHLSIPAMVVTVAGVVAAGLRRVEFAAVLLIWVLCCVAGTVIFAGGIEPARYATGAMPAYMLLAGGLIAVAPAPPWRTAAAIALAAVVGWQLWLVRDVRPTGAGGYEAVAEYVVAHAREPVVLFDSTVDTGYFVFYVRAHDPQRRLVILRADKLFVSPSLRSASDTGLLPDYAPLIYEDLQRFGVQYIVVEERQQGPLALRQLHEQLHTDRFVERLRIPVVSREPMAQGLVLVVYEFVDAQPPDLSATIDIDLPLGRREIKLPLRDLLGTGPR